MSPAARRGGPRQLVELTVMSLDGVISSPERWSAPYWEGDHEEVTDTLMQAAGGLLLGRATYEGLVDYWPHAGGEVAERMNALPEYVASRTLTEVRWNATLLGDDVVTEVAALKEQGGGRSRPGREVAGRPGQDRRWRVALRWCWWSWPTAPMDRS